MRVHLELGKNFTKDHHHAGDKELLKNKCISNDSYQHLINNDDDDIVSESEL